MMNHPTNDAENVIKELENQIITHFVPAYLEICSIKDLCTIKLSDFTVNAFEYIDFDKNLNTTKVTELGEFKIEELALNKYQRVVKLEPYSVSYSLQPASITGMANYGIDVGAQLFSTLVEQFDIKIVNSFLNLIGKYGVENYEESLKWYHKLIRFFFKSYKRKIKVKSVDDITKSLQTRRS